MKMVKVENNFVGLFPDDTPIESIEMSFGGGTVLFVPDGTPVEFLGEYYIADPRLNMTVDKVRECRREDIDRKSDLIIAWGFTYPGTTIRFKMDLEHQMSYKGVFDLRSYVTFPYTIKGVGDGYLTFQNETEMTQFILYSFTWIVGILQNGWELKDDLSALTKEELIAWVDPRS